MPHIFTNAEYADMLYAALTQVAKCIDVDGGIYTYTYTLFLLRKTDTMMSHNIELSSWDTLYKN
jgi:hypothetical protein